ncbi:MAG: FoF1 ATP synthase subunit gamma [Caldilineaceae bacterium]
MQTVEALKHKIKNAEDLLSVVQTMKALAAVSIRHYEKAVAALADYNLTVELGLHILLRRQKNLAVLTPPAISNCMGAIVFGSDQGLCGQLNERIATYTIDRLNGLHVHRAERIVIAVGGRVAALLEEAGQPVARTLPAPGSVAALTPLVQDLLLQIDGWRRDRATDRIELFYNQALTGVRYQPQRVPLLPLDLPWLQRLQQTRWPARTLPTFTMPAEQLFSRLVRQHLFVTLYRACAEAVATENASRLTAMQNAEKSIKEHLDDLQRRFHQQRQQSITAELLDIVAGYEAIIGAQHRMPKYAVYKDPSPC